MKKHLGNIRVTEPMLSLLLLLFRVVWLSIRLSTKCGISKLLTENHHKPVAAAMYRRSSVLHITRFKRYVKCHCSTQHHFYVCTVESLCISLLYICIDFTLLCQTPLTRFPHFPSAWSKAWGEWNSNEDALKVPGLCPPRVPPFMLALCIRRIINFARCVCLRKAA